MMPSFGINIMWEGLVDYGKTRMAACFATIKKHTEEENRILEFF